MKSTGRIYKESFREIRLARLRLLQVDFVWVCCHSSVPDLICITLRFFTLDIPKNGAGRFPLLLTNEETKSITTSRHGDKCCSHRISCHSCSWWNSPQPHALKFVLMEPTLPDYQHPSMMIRFNMKHLALLHWRTSEKPMLTLLKFTMVNFSFALVDLDPSWICLGIYFSNAHSSGNPIRFYSNTCNAWMSESGFDNQEQIWGKDNLGSFLLI